MYERFTDRSRQVMQFANQEAHRCRHEYVGTEHILLGLVKDGAGVAGAVLKNLDVSLRKVRLEVEKVVLPGPADVVMAGRLPQTPRATKVIEYAIEEARGLDHNYVGTEHLLLGLMREEDGVAAQILVNLGLTLDAVRPEVLAILGRSGWPPPEADRPVVARAPTADVFPLGMPTVVRKLVALLNRRIEATKDDKEHAVDTQDFELAVQLREREANLTRARDAIVREWRPTPPAEPSSS